MHPHQKKGATLAKKKISTEEMMNNLTYVKKRICCSWHACIKEPDVRIQWLRALTQHNRGDILRAYFSPALRLLNSHLLYDIMGKTQ